MSNSKQLHNLITEAETKLETIERDIIIFVDDKAKLTNLKRQRKTIAELIKGYRAQLHVLEVTKRSTNESVIDLAYTEKSSIPAQQTNLEYTKRLLRSVLPKELIDSLFDDLSLKRQLIASLFIIVILYLGWIQYEANIAQIGSAAKPTDILNPPTNQTMMVKKLIGDINVELFCKTEFDNSFKSVNTSQQIILPDTGWACQNEIQEVRLTPEDLSKACKKQHGDENAYAFGENGKISWGWQCFVDTAIQLPPITTDSSPEGILESTLAETADTTHTFQLNPSMWVYEEAPKTK